MTSSRTAANSKPGSVFATHPVFVHGRLTLLALLRRRLALGILVALPLVFYLTVDPEAVGRSVRALVFGVTWAVSTVAYFVTSGARRTEPRLIVAGADPRSLTAARIGALVLVGLVLSAVFWLIVVLDQPIRSPAAIAIDFVVSAVVSIALGTAIGALVAKELEGTLVLFLFAGMQAVVNPFERVATFLPLWSSRELVTYAIDGPAQGSLADGLLHALVVVIICAVVTRISFVTSAAGPGRFWRSRRSSSPRSGSGIVGSS